MLENVADRNTNRPIDYLSFFIHLLRAIRSNYQDFMKIITIINIMKRVIIMNENINKKQQSTIISLFV